jgi:hypothetical protein
VTSQNQENFDGLHGVRGAEYTVELVGVARQMFTILGGENKMSVNRCSESWYCTDACEKGFLEW